MQDRDGDHAEGPDCQNGDKRVTNEDVVPPTLLNGRQQVEIGLDVAVLAKAHKDVATEANSVFGELREDNKEIEDIEQQHGYNKRHRAALKRVRSNCCRHEP